jgi:aminopeptidase N
MYNKVLYLVFIVLFIFSCKSSQTALVQAPDVDSVEVPTEAYAKSLIAADEPETGPYRSENTKYHDLIHTRLEVKFNWELQYLLGSALLELKPHFYPQDQLILDAKGFDIHSVQLVEGSDKIPLRHQYDAKKLTIMLDRKYQRNESYFVQVDYTAKPNELRAGGSEAITSDIGLYFINPTGADSLKPQQIWTQGETEASSCWFPTIDSPNQRSTQEIYITVEERFVTLSNGRLIYSQGNNDGTRTDYWKMDQPHPPYLFMMAIGEFAVVKDQWEDLEVSYYVEPEYQKYASQIFGKTPEMLTYFSELLKYPFPWSKYAQVVVRDYVSGAMENTTASVFMEDLQVDSRYLIDQNWDDIIAHELFHQWFGDLVTCESWSNLTLNEAFATYSEYLWAEHLLGKDEAENQGYQQLQSYLEESKEKQVDLIRFYYEDKEDMFDSHSYAKGSRILHMLRAHLGDEAFFETLHQYLKANAGQPVEVHHLRLAAEKVSGEDLNWFFNQWFLNSGHPDLLIETDYANDTLSVSFTQLQDPTNTPIYRLPIDLDIWQSQQRISKSVILDNQVQEFKFRVDFQPDVVIVDPDNKMLAEIKYQRSKEELISQYRVSSQALTRLKALETLLEDSVNAAVVEVFVEALDDSYWAVRQVAVNAFEGYPDPQPEILVDKLRSLAKSDSKSLVRADAITVLSSFENDVIYLPLYLEAIKDSSYSVAGAGLTAYLQIEHPDRIEIAQQFENESDIQLVIPIADFYALNHVPDKYSWYLRQLQAGGGEMMFYMVNYFGQYLTESELEEQIAGAKYLEDLGLNHNMYYIRYSAFQALGLLEGVDEISQMRRRVKDSETDPRLVEVYSQYP